MLTFKMAVRNVLRQKRRTLLTVLTMLGGFTLSAFSIASSDGTYNVIIDMFTRNQMGHIQIHRAGYLDRPTLYNTVDDYETIITKLLDMEQVEASTPRIYSAGLVSVGEKTTGAKIIGIDPERENQTTRFDKKIVAGRRFSASDAHETILGQGLARVLKADLNDTIVVVSQGADGSIANDAYEIVGLVESGDAILDQSAFYLPLATAQELLVLYGRAHELVVVIEELKIVEEVADQIETMLISEDLSVAPWQEFAASFYSAMKTDQRGNWIMLFIVVLIVAVGVFNTILMTVMERTREYGMLRAIGVRPAQVIRLVLYEVLTMAVIALVVGSIISLAANYYFSFEGISIMDPITYGGIEFTAMYTEVNLRSFVIPGITVLGSALLVSIFPAVKAAHTAPARAMRTH